MEDEKASAKKSTVGSKQMGAAIDSRIQQVTSEAIAMALDSGAGGSNQGGSSTRKEFVPGFPCPACGSTKENPIGSKHHFPNNCEYWEFKLGVREGGELFVAKCEKKAGCNQDKSKFQINKENGIVLYWKLDKFKQSKSYQWMVTKRLIRSGKRLEP